jgi:hypothetical protein
MKVSIEEKRAEAIKRMKAFGFFSDTVKLFEKNGTLLSSAPPWGAFYTLDDKQKAAVHKLEEQYDCLVYSVIRSFHQELGVIDNLLYVSDEKDEWPWDWGDIENMCPCIYAVNYNTPEFSEFGSIGVKMGAGAGLIRIS